MAMEMKDPRKTVSTHSLMRSYKGGEKMEDMRITREKAIKKIWGDKKNKPMSEKKKEQQETIDKLVETVENRKANHIHNDEIDRLINKPDKPDKPESVEIVDFSEEEKKIDPAQVEHEGQEPLFSR